MAVAVAAVAVIAALLLVMQQWVGGNIGSRICKHKIRS